MARVKIGNTDIPAEGMSEDLFHIESYIDGLSVFIKECATPMTVSIQGDWGSGKTSMMNMIKGKINDTVCPIWFNTWQFSQFDMGNGLVFSMLEVMLDELGYETQMITKVIDGIKGFSRKLVKVVADSAVSGGADMVEGILPLENTSNKAREILELKDKFQNAIDEKIKKENKNRVVIFVDDLDRLQPEKAVELLEVLKLFLECKNCVFVIAVDYDVVTRGIRQKYGIDVSEEKGKSFFDKIIQLPFKVPVAQYDIENYVLKSLANMNITVSDLDIKLFVSLIKTSIGLNPRSMKRLFNTYQLLDIITQLSVKDIDEAYRHKILFSIICMQMGHEKLYQHFSSTPIEAYFLERIGNPDTIGECLKEIFGEESVAESDSKYLNKMKNFILNFYKSIQCDLDDNISESELSSLQSVLKCSSAVSIGDGEIEDNTSDWNDRYNNRKLAERINEKLSELGILKIWLPRKARKGVKISDVSSSLYFTSKNDFDFSLEYYLSRNEKGKIDVYLMLYNKSSKKEAVFFNTFGENPLNLEIKPEIEQWGRIMYSNVIEVTDDDAVMKISEVYKKAYLEIEKFVTQS